MAFQEKEREQSGRQSIERINALCRRAWKANPAEQVEERFAQEDTRMCSALDSLVVTAAVQGQEIKVEFKFE